MDDGLTYDNILRCMSIDLRPSIQLFIGRWSHGAICNNYVK